MVICVSVTPNQKPRDRNKVLIFVVLAKLLELYRFRRACDCSYCCFQTGTTHIVFFVTPYVNAEPSDIALTSLGVGLQRTQLIKSQIPDPPIPDDVQTFTMTVDRVNTCIDNFPHSVISATAMGVTKKGV